MKVLIVGQGIAGTALADELEQRGCEVYIIDSGIDKSASQVAAGIFNPIINKRFTLSWMADQLLPCAHQYYTNFELRFNAHIRYPFSSYLIFENATHANEWSIREGEKEVKKYISDDVPQDIPTEVIHPLGGLLINGAGYLNTKLYIELFRKHILKQSRFIDAIFDISKLEILREYNIYQGERYDKVVFCEGWKGMQNPLFPQVKYKPAKGEVLTFEMKDLACNYILLKGKYIAPLGDGLYKIGATYDWNYLDTQCTEEGRRQLEKGIHEMLKGDYKMIDHEAGVRPTIADRRPVVDVHPDHSNIYIFNGMGTKGVMIAPWFAKQLADVMMGVGLLSAEVGLARFKD
jgi:glycine/D-amino acid oxidase-like deaminating enzyme